MNELFICGFCFVGSLIFIVLALIVRDIKEIRRERKNG